MLFNPGAEAMLGYLAEEVIGELPDMFHPPEELRRQASRLRALPNFSDICRASVAAGERNQLWRFRRKDGEERTMRMTLTAVAGERGELTGYLATAEDVTEREDAQRALLLTLEHQRTAVERLRELERVKGDFVSTVSHELRTPITSIIGYTELLGDGAVGELTPVAAGDHRPGRPQRPPAAAARRGPADALADRVLGAEDRAGRHRRTHRGDQRPRGDRSTLGRPLPRRLGAGADRSRWCTTATRCSSSGWWSTCSPTR